MDSDNSSNDSWLKHLSATPRSMNAFDLSEKLTKDLKEKPLKDWAEILENADVPRGDEYGAAACIGILVCMLLPNWLAKPTMFVVISNGFTEFKDVLYDKILPA